MQKLDHRNSGTSPLSPWESCLTVTPSGTFPLFDLLPLLGVKALLVTGTTVVVTAAVVSVVLVVAIGAGPSLAVLQLWPFRYFLQTFLFVSFGVIESLAQSVKFR